LIALEIRVSAVEAESLNRDNAERRKAKVGNWLTSSRSSRHRCRFFAVVK
jgi:hypothetical protein